MIYLAATLIVAAVALFVATPLAGGLRGARQRRSGESDRERLEHQRALAVQGIRELQFDREMGKLSEADYNSLRSVLERRALEAMAAIEKLGDHGQGRRPGQVARIHQRAPRPTTPPGSRSAIRFCPECGQRTSPTANFCIECGAELRLVDRATGSTE